MYRYFNTWKNIDTNYNFIELIVLYAGIVNLKSEIFSYKAYKKFNLFIDVNFVHASKYTFCKVKK
ncbi:hypothetical protein Nther_1189 [Natranaerobius thermophilus JW/NM-WN-LF]|uniref:Uncharacterized protein n=1 Tax=Natranaerobius thermophilus (strain ATCC BAA-1301 / DSM 18059 / JW/NM-WN-LF) TaxID=457570 RepID=B2A1N5_NATTJ|nr:hypothetical protein Nther_1189 [Natranaerobius thermophilus JW/NM-WN-LF]